MNEAFRKKILNLLDQHEVLAFQLRATTQMLCAPSWWLKGSLEGSLGNAFEKLWNTQEKLRMFAEGEEWELRRFGFQQHPKYHLAPRDLQTELEMLRKEFAGLHGKMENLFDMEIGKKTSQRKQALWIQIRNEVFGETRADGVRVLSGFSTGMNHVSQALHLWERKAEFSMYADDELVNANVETPFPSLTEASGRSLKPSTQELSLTEFHEKLKKEVRKLRKDPRLKRLKDVEVKKETSRPSSAIRTGLGEMPTVQETRNQDLMKHIQNLRKTLQTFENQKLKKLPQDTLTDMRDMAFSGMIQLANFLEKNSFSLEFQQQARNLKKKVSREMLSQKDRQFKEKLEQFCQDAQTFCEKLEETFPKNKQLLPYSAQCRHTTTTDQSKSS